MKTKLKSINEALKGQGKKIEICFEGEPQSFFQIVDLSTDLQCGPDFDDLDDAFNFILDSWS